jgi:hypothetical protein
MSPDHDAAGQVQDQTTNPDGSLSVEYGDGTSERFETEADPSGGDEEQQNQERQYQQEQQDDGGAEMIDGELYEH